MKEHKDKYPLVIANQDIAMSSPHCSDELITVESIAICDNMQEKEYVIAKSIILELRQSLLSERMLDNGTVQEVGLVEDGLEVTDRYLRKSGDEAGPEVAQCVGNDELNADNQTSFSQLSKTLVQQLSSLQETTRQIITSTHKLSRYTDNLSAKSGKLNSRIERVKVHSETD